MAAAGGGIGAPEGRAGQDPGMIPLTKAHAYGNDFLYVRATALDAAKVDPVRLAVRVCDRHTGVGADGLIVFAESIDGARMRLINADGSDAEISGNGVRALGALLARFRGWHVPPFEGRVLTIETAAGLKRLTLIDADGPARFAFRADMGIPRQIERVALDVAGERIDAVRLDMGNPHCVVFGPLDEPRLARLGPPLQSHAAFPDAVNLEIADVVSRHHLRILVWERGVGPTQSSGTGSCAAAVAAATVRLVDRTVEVEAPGGTQRVEWTEAGVFLTGWAELTFEGHWIADADLTGSVRGR
jgi:diaminopimelate epimerase